VLGLGAAKSMLVKNYFSVALTILFNLLFLYLISVIGRNNRFSKFSRYQRFVLNYSFSYLLLNMVLLPALALSFGRIPRSPRLHL
jgi:hypothetical protein